MKKRIPNYENYIIYDTGELFMENIYSLLDQFVTPRNS